jgi:uncharacterized protein
VTDSPYITYKHYCEQKQLGFQVGVKSQQPVFFPRTLAPGTGEELQWRTSKGLGTVYATTVLHQADAPAFNLALIDLDEGFRMMSRVVDVDPAQVRIGQRVRLKFDTSDSEQPPLPVFELIPEQS